MIDFEKFFDEAKEDVAAIGAETLVLMFKDVEGNVYTKSTPIDIGELREFADALQDEAMLKVLKANFELKEQENE